MVMFSIKTKVGRPDRELCVSTLLTSVGECLCLVIHQVD